MKKVLFGVILAGFVITVIYYMRGYERTPEAPVPAEQEASKGLVHQRLKAPSESTRIQMEKIIGQPVSIRHMTLITDFRTTLDVGDTVRFEAKPMGSMTPFSATEASFIVGDELTVASCDLLSGDPRCATPWDTHQEEPDAIAAGTVVIRIVDSEGNVIPASVKGVKGLKELQRLRISGKIVAMEPGELTVVDADAIQFLD